MLYLQMLPQLADCLVLLIADPFRLGVQFPGDVVNGPALETKPQDLLLAGAQYLGGRTIDISPQGGPAAFVLIALIRLILLQAVVPLPLSLRSFLDGVDGPQEFLPLGALGSQDLLPVSGTHPLEQAAEHLLSTIAPGVGRQTGVP